MFRRVHEQAMRVMKYFFLCFTFLVMTSAVADSDVAPDYSRHYDPKRDPFEDGHAAITNARMTQRRILIELGGNWCAWCKKMEQFISGNETVKKKLDENFVILKINVSDENDNREFLAVFPQIFGYPHFFVTDSNGEVLYSKDTAELLEGGQYSEARFLEFIEHWKPGVKKAKTRLLRFYE